MKKTVTCIFIGMFLVAALFVSGCRVNVNDDHHDRHDHHGPHGPGPHGRHFIIPSFKEIGNGRLKLSFAMSDGEVYQGEVTIAKWSSAVSLFSNTDYHLYYPDFSIKDGTSYGRIVAYGNHGLVLRAECFATDGAFLHGYGLARDNQGNVFPLEF